MPECRLYPKPVQEPHPPIHFGGESDAALKRVADLGQGWFGYNMAQRRPRSDWCYSIVSWRRAAARGARFK